MRRRIDAERYTGDERHIDPHAEYGEQMRQRRLRATLTDITGVETELELDVFAVIELPSHDRLQTVIREGACRAVIDGEQGAGHGVGLMR